jgi:hypothetical protein
MKTIKALIGVLLIAFCSGGDGLEKGESFVSDSF